MLLLLILLLVGGSYFILRVAPYLVLAIAVGIVIAYVIGAILWLENLTGITALFNHSWQFFSGVHSGALVFVPAKSECLDSGTAHAFWHEFGVFLIFIVAIVNAIAGIAAILGTPYGVIVSFWGALKYLFARGHPMGKLEEGLVILLGALVCLVASGLLDRLIHVGSAAISGCPH